MNLKHFVLCYLLIFILLGCKSRKANFSMPFAQDVLHQNEQNLTDLIIYDIFSPPVASRIYAYASLAAYEASRFDQAEEESIVRHLNGFPEMPVPEKGSEYNYALAASKAFYKVAEQMIFSRDSLARFERMTYQPFKENLTDEVFSRSIAFGEEVAKYILKRASEDNYLHTRGMAKYFGSKEDDKWKPTSPDYLDGVEPNWNKIRSFALDSARQFDPGLPPVFSKEKNSQLYRMNLEVYDSSKLLSNEQKDIASFWDDNPFVTHHSGHLMLATKKQTPGGHWIGISTIACRQGKADFVKSAKTYAMVSVALFDAFISCFDTKYKYEYIRPITYVNDLIDPQWEPFLQTPAFPEYTSGHSTITGAAAVILTSLYGDNFVFSDTSNMRYINRKRNFNSFYQAAQECSMSRFYGGIHYKLSLEKGNECGRNIGQFILNKIGYK